MAKKNKATKVVTDTTITNDAVAQTVAVQQDAPQAAPVSETPPGAELAATPVLTDAEKKAKRTEKRKARRLAKMAAEGKLPMSERPKAPNGTIIPREGGARKFCYDIQAANGFPDSKVLTGLLVEASKGTAFEGRPQRWFARRAWRNARLYSAGTPAPVGNEVEA